MLKNIYGYGAWITLPVALIYQQIRWGELGRPPKKSLEMGDIFGRPFLLLLLWPWPAFLMIRALIGRLQGDPKGYATFAEKFDELSGLAQRVRDATQANYTYLPSQGHSAGPTPKPPTANSSPPNVDEPPTT